jgi:hypothetical protein
MSTLASFIVISLDGFYEGANGEFDWLVPDEIVVGSGRSLFEDIKDRISLTLLRFRQFDSGNILLTYRPSP